MTNKEMELVVGSLLHDIGKVVYRTGDIRKHSISGYEKIKETTNFSNVSILNQIKYHHADALGSANIPEDSLAYITYIADNISSGMDRRKANDDEYKGGFDKNIELSSIFNIVNGNAEKKVYSPSMLDTSKAINYPHSDRSEYNKHFYNEVLQNITDNLRGIEFNESYINSLLEVMEANLSFIPSSTNLTELADISLFDHVKLTAAIASSIYKYLIEQQIVDYRTTLYKENVDFYAKEVFMMFSIDISGIQDFIYTVAPDGALKSLRTRSFYLEILMEHIIDELLLRAGLSRANLLYSGGGHAYILLSNTDEHKRLVKTYIKEVNRWFVDNFDTDLYIAAGYAICSAEELGSSYDKNGATKYKELFRKMSQGISLKKMSRYTYDDIQYLNSKSPFDSERECKVCHRTERLNEEDTCDICRNIKNISAKILKCNFFSIVKEKGDDSYLILPFDMYMVAESEEDVKKRIADNSYIRIYGKNKFFTGKNIATKLWVGDYVYGDSFEKLARSANGIKRIGVLRADVDNLGKTFVSGFENREYGDKYVGLSRTTTFSRKMSIFFKNHINKLLEKGEFYLERNSTKGKRNAVIVYAGGDDVFIVGSWDDIIGFAVDLYNSFERFTQNTLTISAGIGIFPEKYPVMGLARETGELEECSKLYESKDGNTKNAITLFDGRYTFSWNDFISSVINEKFKIISDYFEHPLSRGKSFIYHLLEYIRNEAGDKINLARLAYALSRLEPEESKDRNANSQVTELYSNFKNMIYYALKEKKAVNEIELALMLYVYLSREEEE